MWDGLNSYQGSEISQEDVGVEGALGLVKKAGRRVLAADELACLEKFKAWAPIHDLQEVVRAFIEQKEALLKMLNGGGEAGLFHMSESSDVLDRDADDSVGRIDSFDLEDSDLLGCHDNDLDELLDMEEDGIYLT